MIEIKRDPSFEGLRAFGGIVAVNKGVRRTAMPAVLQGGAYLDRISMENSRNKARMAAVQSENAFGSADDTDIDAIASALVSRLRYLGYA